MQKIRLWIHDMGIRKKLIYYSYLVITPVLLLISIVLVVRNYGRMEDSRKLTQMQSVQSLEDNVDVLRQEMQKILAQKDLLIYVLMRIYQRF